MKLQGTVRWFDDVKGFGFIRSDGRDYFVHYSDVVTVDNSENPFRTLDAGSPVEFEPVEEAKGPRAANVVCLNGPSGRTWHDMRSYVLPSDQEVGTRKASRS